MPKTGVLLGTYNCEILVYNRGHSIGVHEWLLVSRLDRLAWGHVLQHGYATCVVSEGMGVDPRKHQLPDRLEERKRSAITDEDWDQG